MSTLMFYKKLVPLNRELHRDLRLNPMVEGFAFAANENALPLAPVEFAQACIEYPIVFAMDDDKTGGPIVLTGIRQKENLFVSANGKWDGDYVPAFVRRYPFVLHEQDNESFMVLIDEECPGFNAEGGERLFAEDGSESPMFAEVVRFLDYFRNQGNAARELVARLAALDLLIPQGIEVQTHEGQKMSLNGFHIVDEKKVGELDDAKLLQLARSGDLALIHAHLASLGNISKLLRRLEPRLETSKAA
ncbi:MAG TPA: SapC family protein [Paucimonas sp.]|nr:SapC family protein [Paucimonas sp.]